MKVQWAVGDRAAALQGVGLVLRVPFQEAERHADYWVRSGQTKGAAAATSA